MSKKPPNPDLADSLRLGGIEDPTEEEQGPQYEIYKGSKVPVSKRLGKVWQGRIDQARAARKTAEVNWNEAIKYYNNDQMGHRRSTEDGDSSGNTAPAQRIGMRKYSETENVVFSNAATLLPILYAKSPHLEMTATDEETNGKWVSLVEKVVNRLVIMKDEPGLNLKPAARRGVLWALLTNTAILKIGWTRKEDSDSAQLVSLEELGKRYAEAKTRKDIEEIEGELMALESTMDLLTPAGPNRKLVSPFRLFVDPTSNEADYSDAKWIAEEDYLPTSFLRTMFGKKMEGRLVSQYEPTHVLKVEMTDDDTDNDQSFSLFNTDTPYEAKSYGYQTEEAFRAAQYTKVFYIWDKTTRRVLLFAAHDFSWPLWVWDDPLQLLRFFPYHPLHFHEAVEGHNPKGEVTYYLDQQDAINEINSEIRLARHWAKNNIFYKKGAISQADVEAVLKGPDGTAKPIELEEGQSLKDVIFSAVPPSLNTPELFNTESKFTAIGKITGLNEAIRGGQFKTNTTNKAVDAYSQAAESRIDEKIDAIEDWIGDFGWSLVQLVCRLWTADDVGKIVGTTAANDWKQIADPNELRTMLNIRVVGGSSDKPTSKAKKKSALEIGQVLGQFGQQIPMIGIIALKLIARAYDDDVIISSTEWDKIFKSIEQQQQQGQGAPAQDGGQPLSPADAAAIKAEVAKLPTEKKQELEALLKKGVPAQEALHQVKGTAPAQQQEAAPTPQRH